MSIAEERMQQTIGALSFGEPRVCLVSASTYELKQYSKVAVVTHYDKEGKSFVTADGNIFYYAEIIPSAECLDELAVDNFALNMKQRLKEKRKEGRGGWHNCSKEELTDLLTRSLEKGNPVDIANFCAFLSMRGFDYEPNEQA